MTVPPSACYTLRPLAATEPALIYANDAVLSIKIDSRAMWVKQVWVAPPNSAADLGFREQIPLSGDCSSDAQDVEVPKAFDLGGGVSGIENGFLPAVRER